MLESELQIGDLIFFLDTLSNAEHIALFVSMKDDVPYVIHATSAPYYAVMLTRLKPADIGCAYRVVRPIHKNLALIATGILFQWVEHLVPYASREKFDAIMNELDQKGGIDNPNAGIVQEAHGKATYESNYAQYLIMANSLPYIPHEEGKIKGLRCAETIVAAFNIALVIMHATLIQSFMGYEWILDGYSSLEVFIASLNNPLPFDAKTTLPAGILTHCLKDKAQWIDQGMLFVDPGEDPAPEKCREIWCEFKTALQTSALEKVNQFLSSPKASLDPSEYARFFGLTPQTLGRSLVCPSPPFVSASPSIRSSVRLSPSFFLSIAADMSSLSRDRSISTPMGYLGFSLDEDEQDEDDQTEMMKNKK